MKIKIKNENGVNIVVASALYGAQLVLTSIDFGSITETVNSDTINGVDGEIYYNSTFGSRDITFQFLNKKYNPRQIMAALSPKTGGTLEFDNNYTISGKFTGTPTLTQPAYNTDYVYAVTFRAFDPYFKAISGERTLAFENSGGNLYENGTYKYQKLIINNSGDCGCPLYVSLEPTTADGKRGLFTVAEWNSGNPIYEGWAFKSDTAKGKVCTIDTDKRNKNAYADYDYFMDYPMYILPPGNSLLYALNVKGSLKYNPRYISIREG